ncbi:hypothetical protein R3P38DRAFT_3205455 [Favolaschia claudopus]|uniref:Uncharacterized protein n=1 Tax=Favolaschia claudopus TaxID=2862362 RepID=A0AAW0APP5_9AGAR
MLASDTLQLSDEHVQQPRGDPEVVTGPIPASQFQPNRFHFQEASAGAHLHVCLRTEPLNTITWNLFSTEFTQAPPHLEEKSRKNPKLLCAVLETFFLFEFERYCAIDEFLGPSLTLNKKCGKNTEDVNSSYLLITKKEIDMRYQRMLAVHKQDWCTMSARKYKLVAKYNYLSVLSHKEENPDLLNNAPWPFDLADLAPALLMFGHMGPAIVDNWAKLYSTEGEKATTEAMRTRARHLPPSLTMLQRIMFKPQPDMSDEEIQSLRSAFGTTDNAEPNPIVRYFAERASYAQKFTQSELAKPYPQRSDPSSSSQSSATQLMSDHAEESEESENAMTAAAAALEIAMELFDDVEGIGDGMDLVDDAIGGDLPVLTDSEEEEDDLMEEEPEDDADDLMEQEPLEPWVYNDMKDPTKEDERTWIEWGEDKVEALTLIKDTKTRKCRTRLCKSAAQGFYTWTAFKPPIPFPMQSTYLKTHWIISLCQWDPTLSVVDQLKVNAAWKAIGAWLKGFRKDTRLLVRKAMNLRSKVRNEMRKSWPLARPMEEVDVLQEVLRRKQRARSKKASTKQAKAQQAAKAASKKNEKKAAVRRVRPPRPTDIVFRSARLSSMQHVPTASDLLNVERRGPRKSS